MRFNLFHSSFCFINSHFAASVEEVEKRNNVRTSFNFFFAELKTVCIIESLRNSSLFVTGLPHHQE